MDLDDIKRGLRAEIKKRENEQYFTFQCNVRQMCKDVLAKLEEQESEIVELKEKLDLYKRGWAENDKVIAYLYAELRHQKYKRCLGMANKCVDLCHKAKDLYRWAEDENLEHHYNRKIEFFARWHNRWLKLAEKFKPNKE